MFLTDHPIAVEEFTRQKPDASCGAVVTFAGVVRAHDHGKPVQKLYYECYRPMADKEIRSIVDRVKNAGAVHEIKVLHRLGWLNVGEVSVVVVVTAPHRGEAFAACKAVIDDIKKTVPIWKKEIYTDGTSEWVGCSHEGEGEGASAVNARGIILAGGRSRRFGTDKAMARLDGATLLEGTVGRLEALNLKPVVITNESADYSFLHCPVHRDRFPNQGPLGGVYTACRLFPDATLLVLTCDMPALTRQSLQTLLHAHDKQNLVTVYRTDQHLQPFPGVYEGSLASQILRRIRKKQLSMHGFIEHVSSTRIIQSQFSPEIFYNVNEPTDLVDVRPWMGTPS